MRRLLLTTLLAISFSLPLFGQTSELGLLIGKSESVEHGLNFDLNDTVWEAYYAFKLEDETLIKLKGGQLDTVNEFSLGDPVTPEGRIEYVSALIEYRFYEVFGSTGLFAGPGFYRQEFGAFHENDYGLAVGVNAHFPISRRFALMAELGYHWVHFAESRSFFTAAGGARISF